MRATELPANVEYRGVEWERHEDYRILRALYVVDGAYRVAVGWDSRHPKDKMSTLDVRWNGEPKKTTLSATMRHIPKRHAEHVLKEARKLEAGL